MEKIGCGTEIVDATENGISEAKAGATRALPEQRVGHRAVNVVNDAQRRASRRSAGRQPAW
jgi:hypothetical protein